MVLITQAFGHNLIHSLCFREEFIICLDYKFSSTVEPPLYYFLVSYGGASGKVNREHDIWLTLAGSSL